LICIVEVREYIEYAIVVEGCQCQKLVWMAFVGLEFEFTKTTFHPMGIGLLQFWEFWGNSCECVKYNLIIVL
jgi:hypothetical protein